jgi:hypothetical protein
MSTKIFVSQIDSTNPDGSSGLVGSYIVLGSTGALWSPGNAPPVGYEGSIGAIGPTGVAGFNGSAGLQGIIGDQGFEGFQGSAGSNGNVGYGGSVGFEGSIGATGIQGNAGYLGSAGFQGTVGFKGSFGDTGFIGSAGSQGIIGFTGSTGDPFQPQMNFTQILDLSPNTYTAKANYLVKVNSSANGITLIDGNTYIQTTTINRAIEFVNTALIFSGTSGNFIYGANIVFSTTRSVVESVYYSNTTTNSVLISNTNVAKVTLRPSSGTIVTITLPPTVSAFSNKHLSLTTYLKQDETGARTVDWSNNTIRWPLAEGVPVTGPSLSTTAGYVDVVTFTSFDGGSSWYGFLSAKGFSS